MSHFTKIDRANIVDVNAFIAACRELGLTQVRTNVSIRDYYGATQQVDVAVSCGNYDIALVKNGDKYDLTADWWGVMRKLPSKLASCKSENDLQTLLIKHTTAQTIVARYQRQGYRATVREDDDENLQIELVRTR